MGSTNVCASVGRSFSFEVAQDSSCNNRTHFLPRPQERLITQFDMHRQKSRGSKIEIVFLGLYEKV